MSVIERLQLIEVIWESIATDSGELQLSGTQIEALDPRCAKHQAGPDRVVPWDEVKSRALQRATQ